MTWTKQPATNEDLTNDAPPAPRNPGTADTHQSTSDTEPDMPGESRTDPASLLRPNPTFPEDEAD